MRRLTWADFPRRKEADGWHCRKCLVLLTGRRTSWCSRVCEKATLLLVEWRYIRACIRRRDHYRCVLCGKPGHEVDHIIELADGGCFYDWDNLRTLCSDCHKKKTAASRTARARVRAAHKKAEKFAEKLATFGKPVSLVEVQKQVLPNEVQHHGEEESQQATHAGEVHGPED